METGEYLERTYLDPFVDNETAKAQEPEVFETLYDDEEDQPYFHAMVKHFTDPEIMVRVDSDFANKKILDTEPVVSDDLLSDFLNKAERYRLLTADEEVVLARDMKLGVTAYKKMAVTEDWNNEILQGLARQGAYSYQAFFHANLRLVVTPVMNYQSAYKHIQLVDGLQYAYIGLQRAIEKFDETKGFKFSTYAYKWIKQALARNIANSSRIIRLPVPVDYEWKKYTKVVDRLRTELGREPTFEETQQTTGLKDEKIKTFEFFGQRSTPSLNRSINENGIEFGETIVTEDPNERRIEATSAARQLREVIDAADLTDIEKMVLSIRNGVKLPELEGTVWKSGTYEEIFDQLGVKRDDQAESEDPLVPPRTLGVAIGVNYTTIKQIEEQALEQLRYVAERQ